MIARFAEFFKKMCTIKEQQITRSRVNGVGKTDKERLTQIEEEKKLNSIEEVRLRGRLGGRSRVKQMSVGC